MRTVSHSIKPGINSEAESGASANPSMNLSVDLGKGLKLQNPIMTASGTFGYGEEYEDLTDVDSLGAFVMKGTTLEPREGNPYPRMVETPSGMINAVGLQNKGIDHLLNETMPRVAKYRRAVPIVNLSGNSIESYAEAARRINDYNLSNGDNKVRAVELNISCPNVKQGGMAFGTDPAMAAKVTRAVRNAYAGHLMVKLSPNVTDITAIAVAVQDAGADSVSLVNTFLAMAIDSRTRRPMLSTVTGGLSGPAIKPIALRMVWQVHKKVYIPVVGLGGIQTVEDAIEFILAGAAAVQVGTANFARPDAAASMVDGLRNYLSQSNYHDVGQLVGALRNI